MPPELLAGICFKPAFACDQILKNNVAIKPICLDVQLKREIRLAVCLNAFLHNNVPGCASIELLPNHATDNNDLKTQNCSGTCLQGLQRTGKVGVLQ